MQQIKHTFAFCESSGELVIAQYVVMALPICPAFAAHGSTTPGTDTATALWLLPWTVPRGAFGAPWTVGKGAFGAGVMSKSEQKLFSKKPNAEAGQAYHFYNCLLEINLTWSHCSENKTRRKKKKKTKQLLKAFLAWGSSSLMKPGGTDVT